MLLHPSTGHSRLCAGPVRPQISPALSSTPGVCAARSVRQSVASETLPEAERASGGRKGACVASWNDPHVLLPELLPRPGSRTLCVPAPYRIHNREGSKRSETSLDYTRACQSPRVTTRPVFPPSLILRWTICVTIRTRNPCS